MFAEDYSQRTRQAGADDPAHADHAAVPDARGGRRGVHGHAELAQPVLRARAVARDVQRREHPVRDPARAADAAGGPAADHRDGDRRAHRRRRADPDPVAGAAQGRLSLPAGARSARARAAPGADSDGAGHARARGHADQRVRQHRARDGRGHGRGVVAELRVPADVPAARNLRRLDRDGRDAGDRAPCGAGRHPRHAARGGERDRDDDRAERARHARPDRARPADRRHAVRARGVHAARYRRNGGRAHVLRDRADRLFGREGRLADVLRAARESQARDGQRRQRARQRRAQHRVRQALRVPGPRGRHLADRPAERVGAAGDAAAAARRHRRDAPARRVRPEPGRVARHGGSGVRDGRRGSPQLLPGRSLLVQVVRVGTTICRRRSSSCSPRRGCSGCTRSTTCCAR